LTTDTAAVKTSSGVAGAWPYLALTAAGMGYLLAGAAALPAERLSGALRLAVAVLPHQLLMLGGVVAVASWPAPRELLARLALQPCRGRDLALGALAALMLFPLLMVTAQAAAWVLTMLGRPPEEPPLLSLARAADRPGLAVLLLAAVVVAPCAEELVFRRVLHCCLRRSLPALPALLITAALFAGFHLSLAHAVPMFILGLALQAAVMISGSLWPAIIMHAAHNAIAMALFLCARQWFPG